MTEVLDLRIGRLRLPTANNEIREELGQVLETLGAIVVPSGRRARRAPLSIPIYSEDGAGFDAEVMRRQIRALLNNSQALLSGLPLRIEFDPELDGWIVVGGGDVAYTEAGRSLHEYEVELTDPYYVGAHRTHRAGYHVHGVDRTLATTARDIRRKLFSSDWHQNGTATPRLVVALTSDRDLRTVDGRGRTSNQVAARRVFGGFVPLVYEAYEGETWTAEPPPDASVGDVVIYRRRRSFSFGHSITLGIGATDQTNDRWASLLSRGTAAEQVVSAVGGARLMHENVAGPNPNPNGYARYMQLLPLAPFKGNYLPPPYSWIGMFMGAADAGWIGAAGIDALKYDNALRGFVSRTRSYMGFEAEIDNNGWTVVSGTWSVVTPGANTKCSGTGYRQATANGATLRFTTPRQYDGGPIAFLFWVPHTNVADVALVVDGIAPLGTYSLRGADFADVGGTRGTCRIIRLTPEQYPTLLTPGVHTFDFTAANISGGGIVAADAVQFESRAPKPTLLFEQFPFFVDPGFPFTLSPTLVGKLNEAIRRVAAEFDRATTVPTRDVITEIGLTLDGVHPTTEGYRRLARAALPHLVELMENR